MKKRNCGPAEQAFNLPRLTRSREVHSLNSLQDVFFVSMSRLNKVIAIKLAGQPESLAGLSDLGSNLPRLTSWVDWVLLSPAKCYLYLRYFGKWYHNNKAWIPHYLERSERLGPDKHSLWCFLKYAIWQQNSFMGTRWWALQAWMN